MSVWEMYDLEQRKEYLSFLKIFGALTNLFRQKNSSTIPLLDSKFQETIFARVFNSENVDIGNTPHDILSIFGDVRIGIGIKTWQNTKTSYQKVMQIKRYKSEIEKCKNDKEQLAHIISKIKNENMIRDYNRLGLKDDCNIYHYVTRDRNKFVIHECSYPLIMENSLTDIKLESTSLCWSDGIKDYKFTFSDSQIWQKFSPDSKDNIILDKVNIEIIKDPFEILLKLYSDLSKSAELSNESDEIEVYLPLYSYRSKKVEEKSGLNAWNAAPKNTRSHTLRPLNEIYIPIPIEFHRANPNFFCKDIFQVIQARASKSRMNAEVKFNLKLPNGKIIPALLTGDNMKNFQSGSSTEINPETNKLFGQSALGQWLLIDVLGLSERKLVTKEWLEQKGTDSVRLWRKKDDYSLINIDFAEIDSFENFMNEKLNNSET